MAQTEIIKITCPDCKKVIDYKIYRSVNVCIDKELKKEILNLSIFKFECDCGVSSKAFYPFLYHDSDLKIMIQYCKESNLEEYKKELESIIENNSAPISGYRYRIVTDPYLLIEKVLLFESEYDDRIIEVMKEFLIASGKIENVDKLLFAKNKDGSYCFLVLGKNGVSLGTMPLEKHLYDMVYNGFYNKVDEYLIVDQKWARKFLEEVKL